MIKQKIRDSHPVFRHAVPQRPTERSPPVAVPPIYGIEALEPLPKILIRRLLGAARRMIHYLHDTFQCPPSRLGFTRDALTFRVHPIDKQVTRRPRSPSRATKKSFRTIPSDGEQLSLRHDPLRAMYSVARRVISDRVVLVSRSPNVELWSLITIDISISGRANTTS